MTREEKDKFILENWDKMTNQRIADELHTSESSIRRAKKRLSKPKNENLDRIGRLAEMLDEKGIDIGDIGSIKQVKLNEWQGMYKDESGEAQVVDMSGASFVFNPKWSDGPEWPVVQPAPKAIIKPAHRRKANGDKFKTCIVLPDPQIGFWRDIETGELTPFHDNGAMDLALQVILDLNPDLIVNLGDFLDFAEFSRFEQEPGFALTTQASINRGYEFLAEQRVNAPNARIILIEGNHDRRLQKAIVNNSKAAFGLKRAAATPERWPVLSVPSLLNLDELGVEYIEGYPSGVFYINKRLQCIHGRIVRSGGSTAKAVSHDERMSTIMGHIHRIEAHYKTVNVYEGARTNMAISPGTLARIDGAVPSTKGSTDVMGRPIKSYEDWQQGFGVVTYREGDKPFAYEQVYINGRFLFFRGVQYGSLK